MIYKAQATDGLTLAQAGLIEALDRSPRTNWPKVIELAMTSVHQIGYSKGFRTANMGQEPTTEPAGAPTPPHDPASPFFEGRKDVGQYGTIPGTMNLTAAQVDNRRVAQVDNMRAAKEIAGEDRALLNEPKNTEDDDLEDAGHEFVRAIARHFGKLARDAGARPDLLKFEWIKDPNDPTSPNRFLVLGIDTSTLR